MITHVALFCGIRGLEGKATGASISIDILLFWKYTPTIVPCEELMAKLMPVCDSSEISQFGLRHKSNLGAAR